MKTLFRTTFFIAILIFIASCNDDENSANGTGIASFSLSEISEIENANQALTLNVGIDNFNHSGGTLNIDITGATYGADYETSGGSASFALEVPANNLITSFSIIPVDNDVLDGNKTLTITISSATGNLEVGENNTMTYRIVDNEQPIVSVLNFEANAIQINENDATATPVNITFDLPSTNGGTVTIDASGDAVFGTDYTVEGQTASPFSITVDPGASSASFNIMPVDNSDFAADKSATFTMTDAQEGVSLGTTVSSTVTIVNDDASPYKLIDFSTTNPTTISEDGGTLTLNFDISEPTTQDATVELTVNTSSTATVGTDFTLNGNTASPYVITVLTGSSTASIDIPITDDAVIETDETITLEITDATGGLQVGVNTTMHTATITDNDAYVETFETATDLASIGYNSFALTAQDLPSDKIFNLNTNAGKYADVNDVTQSSDSGLVIFYKNTLNGNGQMDNVVISPMFYAEGSIETSIDLVFNQQPAVNNATITFYYSETYDGSGTWNDADWTAIDTETAQSMQDEGFPISTYKRNVMNLNINGSFYLAVRHTQTIDDTFWKTQWRLDNFKVQAN